MLFSTFSYVSSSMWRRSPFLLPGIILLPVSAPGISLLRGLAIAACRCARSVRCRARLFRYRNAQNSVAARYLVNDVHAFAHAPEDCVAAVQMRLRRVCDEPLRAACVLAGQSHADRAALVRQFVYLAANLVARAAVSVAARVAALYDKVRNDTMKG